MADGFLGRWSQRKQAARNGQTLTEPTVAPPPSTQTANLPSASVPPAPAQDAAATAPVPTPSPSLRTPPPTLDDVQALTPQDSFARFVTPDVPPAVRNAAMKKLFADPHFNVMDGLDVYIDDYSKPSPMPAAMLRQMASAKFLKLFDEAPDTAAIPDTPENPAPTPAPTLAVTPDADAAVTAAACPLPVEESAHDHPDLSLQSDHAAGCDSAQPPSESTSAALRQPVPPRSV